MGRKGCGLGDWSGRERQIGKTPNEAAKREDSDDWNNRSSQRRNHKRRSSWLWTIVEIDPAHRKDSSHGLRQRYGARRPRARHSLPQGSRARSRLHIQAYGFCHEVRIDSIRPCRWASGLVGPGVYRPDNVARRAASKVFATEPEQVGSRQSRERPSGVAPGRPFLDSPCIMHRRST
jgi:hypothetical protein